MSARTPARSVAREIKRRDQAVDDLGARVKRGPVKLASTRRLTPSRAGFRAMGRVIDAVHDVTKKHPKAVTFKLSVRYRGADGRFKKAEAIEGSFPLPRAIRSRRKKGESERKAFERITEQRIKSAVFRTIDRTEGVVGYTPAVRRALASGDRDRITRAMRAFRARRGVSFKLDVERQVTRARPVSRRSGHGRRRER